MFQISFALCYLQKNYNFTHNDLHVNNIMFKKTDKHFFIINSITFTLKSLLTIYFQNY